MGDLLYDQDFYLWTQDQARRLRALQGDNRLDTDNLAEEVADLGRSELNKVASHLRQAFVHLLKAAWVSDERLRAGWTAEVLNHLNEAQDSFTPGMRRQLDLERAWRNAVRQARAKVIEHGETALPAPTSCPFTLDALLDEAFDVDAAIESLASEPGDDGDTSGA